MTEASNSPQDARRIVVIGGGVSAASFIVQLLRATAMPLHLTVIEPREHMGRGLAYSATDPDHRLNGPLDAHWIDPERPLELRQWCEAQGRIAADPECLTTNGQVFLRRSELGRYLSGRIDEQLGQSRGRAAVRHVRDTAVSVERDGDGYRVTTRAHGPIRGDMLLIATGNPVPALRAPFDAAQKDDPRIIANPLEPQCLDRISPSARVLVVGSGLTALDIVSTLVRRDHRGGILVVSRRGYRPKAQSPESLQGPPRRPEFASEIPAFIAGRPATIAAWTRALRQEIARRAAEGQNWYASFDAVRDVVWQLWPQLPARERMRFLRRLRVFYDVHRFRTPPMNEAMVAAAQAQGLVQYEAATLRAVETREDAVRVQLEHAPAKSLAWHDLDCVVNCTGLDGGAAWRSNPALQSLLRQGLLRLHPTGIGFDVTERCEALDARGTPQSRLVVIGPPSAGAFGDPVAIPFIANQVRRILADVVRTLESIQPEQATHHEPHTTE